MGNPACTVCHTVLDPVAGAFQNYFDDGDYKLNWGGVDSLDDFYKYPEDSLIRNRGRFLGREADLLDRVMAGPGFSSLVTCGIRIGHHCDDDGECHS